MRRDKLAELTSLGTIEEFEKGERRRRRRRKVVGGRVIPQTSEKKRGEREGRRRGSRPNPREGKSFGDLFRYNEAPREEDGCGQSVP